MGVAVSERSVLAHLSSLTSRTGSPNLSAGMS